MSQLLDMSINCCLYETRLENIEFAEKVQRATQKWQLTPDQQQLLSALLGFQAALPVMLLSDIRLRIESRRAMVSSLKANWETLIGFDTPTYFFTFADDIGLTSDRSPVLQTAALRSKIDKAIRAMGLSGIIQIELQAITNYPQGGIGRTLMLHGHAICWGKVRPKALQVKVDDLNQTRSWSNHFGIDPIKFRRLHDGIADVVQMGFYIDKLPRSGKNRIERRNEPGNFMLMETIAGYRDELALRVFEGLSHIPITDAVFSVGDGKFVRKAWKAQLTDWHRARLESLDVSCPVDVPALWTQVRSENGSKLFEPYAVM